MQKLLYVYEERIPEELRDIVRSAFPDDEFRRDEMTYLTPVAEQRARLGWADVVLFAPGRFLPDDTLAAARSVKLMQLWSSGYDKFNLAGARRLGLTVANNNGANAQSVAEHAVMLMLAVLKSLPDSHRRTTAGAWSGNSHGLDMFTLNGKTVGIVGFGNIGQRVAAIVKGFGARSLFSDPRPVPPERAAELGATPVAIDDLIDGSDIVTLHLHANAATDNIMSRSAISRMKKGAVLINVSRAALVDLSALREALIAGSLRGAGLDVYPVEPTVPGDPLLALPNVVATPHMAGSTRDAYAAALAFSCENFRRVARGETPLGIVSSEG